MTPDRLAGAPTDGTRRCSVGAADTRTVRESGHGHVVIVGGLALQFDVISDGSDLTAVVIGTHFLSDAEALWRARAYLDGPYARRYADVASEWGWATWRDAWPGVDDDLDGAVRQVWGRWHVVTREECDRHFQDTGDDWEHEPGDRRFIESPSPGEGLSPVTVVELIS